MIFSLAGISVQDFLSTGPSFLTGLGLLFIVNIFVIGVSGIYVRKKKLPPGAVFMFIALIINLGFYQYAQHHLNKEAQVEAVEFVLAPDKGPLPRDYPTLKMHTISRDNSFGTISALDADKTAYCLRTGTTLSETQIYDSSFYIVMQGEDQKFDTPEKILDYAKFVILIYYHESEPAYFQSPEEFYLLLANRINPHQQKLAQNIRQILDSKINDTDKIIEMDNNDNFPENEETLISENQKNGNTNEDIKLEKFLSKISPPDLTAAWDESFQFNLYSYSFRYKEAAEWSFTIFPDGNIEVEKAFEYNHRE